MLRTTPTCRDFLITSTWARKTTYNHPQKPPLKRSLLLFGLVCLEAGLILLVVTTLVVQPARYEILLVLALGQAGETVGIDPVQADGDTKYWRDAAGVHHVPKRALDDLILA